VRVFPRLFQEIQAIGNVPSFVRPDGGAAIAQTGAATKILLVNAFGLGPADNFPSPANLAVDIVVTYRNLRRRMFSQVTVTVAAGPESAAGIPANFGGAPLLGAPASSRMRLNCSDAATEQVSTSTRRPCIGSDGRSADS
jgi:hypothetical protein